MQINANRAERAVVKPEDVDWVPSPAPGVERRMLYRQGDEVAIATSIVRYAPGSAFAEHVHDAGEEFLVLNGVFSDGSGDFPQGTYVRNPPGSAHAPFTTDGTVILVALRQFDPADSAHVVIDSTDQRLWRASAQEGVSTLPLHRFGTEVVRLMRLDAGTELPAHDRDGGEEVFVIDGVLEDAHGAYPAGTWIRNPHGSSGKAWTTKGALLYVRTGHMHPGTETGQELASL